MYVEIIALVPEMKECLMELLRVTESVWDPATSLAERNHPELGADHLPPVCGEAHPGDCTTHPTVSHQGQGHKGNGERFFSVSYPLEIINQVILVIFSD